MTTTVSTTNVEHGALTLFALGESQSVTIPWTAQSHRGFRDWALSEIFPDRGRISFVDGEVIIDMSPECFETHNAIKVEITSVIHFLVKKQQAGRVFGDRSMFTNETAGISTEPDAMFVRADSFRTGRCQLVDSPRPGIAQELVGAPDWVLEIVSKSSVLKDTKLLRERYFQAGIREYWLVDALSTPLSFQILVPGEMGYEVVQPVSDWHVSPTFNCKFRLTREKDEQGFWLYSLQLQESHETLH